MPEFFNFSPDKKPESFNFSAQEVLHTLQAQKSSEGFNYVGTATSHFQAEPVMYNEKGEKEGPVSDWELTLADNLSREKSKIHGIQDEKTFPKFLDNKEAYAARSQEIGQNMFRFSLDFARLCPKAGEFNEELMGEYVKALALIKAHGQEPMLSLYHWPMPNYLLKMDKSGNINAGGWENPDVAKHFRFYVEKAVQFLGDDTKVRAALSEQKFTAAEQEKFISEGLAHYFLSINEPTSIAMLGYMSGVFPPYKKGRPDLVHKVTGKLVEAHDIAYNEVKNGLRQTGEKKVGVAHTWPYLDGAFGDITQTLFNQGPTDRFERNGGYSDFIGLQYYFRMTTDPFYQKSKRQYGDHPDFGDIYPRGMYENLKLMHEQYPKKEIFISEVGFSEKNDLKRPYWILETVRYLIEALKHNIPVKGMLLWSMVNNFEWALGMDQKFGLFDEKQLHQPLSNSPAGAVRGWEAWQAASTALVNPTEESLATLQRFYETAQKQFAEALEHTESE